MRRLRFCFFFFIFFLLIFSLCEAATISPELQSVLQTVPSYQEVPIIINLTDKVDVKQIPTVPTSHTREGRTVRRNAIAAALKDKADKTQGPLKTLLQSRGGKKMKPLWLTNSIAVTVPASVISELSGSPQIASIELDAVIPASPITPAVAGTPRWNIDRVNAPALWAAGTAGSGSVVANFDTGVDVNHPDLKYRWRGGSCSAPPDCPSWFDPYGNTTLPFAIPATGGSFTLLDATHAHGTHTMGIMVGGSASIPSNAIGVAPGARWIAAKIFDDSGNGDISKILEAFQWALAPAGDAANAPDVVNNSWTISAQNTCDTSLLAAISNLTAAGIEVVFSVGNVDTPPAPLSSSFSPANNAGVFAVGATHDDVSNTIETYSARGPSACDGATPSSSPARTTYFPNVVAPGFNVYSSVPTGGKFGTYNYFSGTSMAPPHISGASALLEGAMPALTPEQIEEALQNSALPLGSFPPNDTYGYGLLDVCSAYIYAFTNFGKGNVSQIAGMPSSAYFVNGASTCTSSNPDPCTITIVNQGITDLNITNVSVTNPGDFTIITDGCSGQTINALTSNVCSGQAVSLPLSCNITVAFSPTLSGSESATLSISSNDPATATLNVPLRGNDPVAQVHDSEIVATYPDIQTASDNCSNWDDIRLQADASYTFPPESPVFNLPLGITVSLLGGYDSAFSLQTGFTTIQGTLTISKGAVIVGNIILQ